jgi:hypothetical protein
MVVTIGADAAFFFQKANGIVCEDVSVLHRNPKAMNVMDKQRRRFIFL